MKLFVLIMVLCGLFGMRQTAQSQTASNPYYQVTIIGDSIKAINYLQLKGSTKIDFRGTALLPNALGHASVKNDLGAITIDTKFFNLEPPTKFGPQYLTYVLWAVSPEGRASNLGELILDGTESKITVTT